jgi:hypothetical protein
MDECEDEELKLELAKLQNSELFEREAWFVKWLPHDEY